MQLSNTRATTAKPQTTKPSTPKPQTPKPARPASGSAKSIILEQRRVRGTDVKIVRINLWDKHVFISPILPPKGLGKGGEKFDRLVSGSSALAIINGGYFHPRAYTLAGDLVKDGKHFATQGPVRTSLAITPDNRVSVRVQPRGGTLNWHEFETAISNGPWVLRQGQVMVVPRAEGYQDRAIERPAPRSAVGITSERKMFFVSTRRKINLYDLAKIMKALGARDAITLDGGSSVGLAWKGKVLIRPARKLAYAIGVYVRK